MENKQIPSKKLMSIKEEKLLRKVDYDTFIRQSQTAQKPQLIEIFLSPRSTTRRQPSQKILVTIKPPTPPIKTIYIAEKTRYNCKKGPQKSGSDLGIGDHSSFTSNLEISPRSTTRRQPSQKILVTIKPRTPPIKTIYIAEKTRYNCKKGPQKSGSDLGIGDHSSFTSSFSEDCSHELNYVNLVRPGNIVKSQIEFTNESSVTDQVASSTTISKSSNVEVPRQTLYNARRRSAEKCYIYTQPQLNMKLPQNDVKTDSTKADSKKVDIGTYVYTDNSTEDTVSSCTIIKLNKRIDNLERKLIKQAMVFRSMNPNVHLSSDEDSKHNIMRASESARPGCSYIEQYSHVPETSAFQRYAHQAAPLSASKTTTLEKEHNSEQYGRDFTTYDGITARGRRQCASVPCKRDDTPKLAAERVHKIRHKLNPVRDYRLMDTIHYLAQGEFAPRDDGIKLTPSREAVLSDIIYEDVCRTHWPNTRLCRRAPHAERCSTRCELQRLIDNLLRERVAHVERRRRRHYRIVKLNHRHESCRPVGKTGDIIVASHKNKNDEREISCDHNAFSAMLADKRREERSSRKSPQSHDRFTFPNVRRSRRYEPEDCTPGPSYAARSPANREPTCCYHTSNNIKDRNINEPVAGCRHTGNMKYLTSSSSISSRLTVKTPRLVVKKEASRRKCPPKEAPDLEHYILLPTLVVRTPSNVKRQKKFNELYHRILKVQLNDARNDTAPGEKVEKISSKTNTKKDVGFNINITLSDSSR